LGKVPCTDLIRKPIFNIFPLLGKLGNERYFQTNGDAEYGRKYGVLATRDQAWGYAFLVWNFEDGLSGDVNERTIALHLDKLDRGAVFDLLHFRIDENHSNAYGVWQRLGKPELTREHIKTLRDGDGLELLEAPRSIQGQNSFDINVALPMHAVSLALLVKRGFIHEERPYAEKFVDKCPALTAETGALGNRQVFIRWPYSKRPDLAGYKVYRCTGRMPAEAPAVIVNDPMRTQNSYYIDMDVNEGSEYGYAISALYADGAESRRSPFSKIKL
jgi:xylan 1,4-beta-xylosidase